MDCSQLKGASKISVVSGDRFASLCLDTPAEKKKRYSMETYYQGLFLDNYLLLINDES